MTDSTRSDINPGMEIFNSFERALTPAVIRSRIHQVREFDPRSTDDQLMQVDRELDDMILGFLEACGTEPDPNMLRFALPHIKTRFLIRDELRRRALIRHSQASSA